MSPPCAQTGCACTARNAAEQGLAAAVEVASRLVKSCQFRAFPYRRYEMGLGCLFWRLCVFLQNWAFFMRDFKKTA